MTYEVPETLVADKPKAVLLCVTDVCNLTCVQCPHVNPVNRWSHTSVPPEKIREASDHAQYLSLHGAGEVLMHPHWSSFVPDPPDYARNVCFVTNGTLFTPRNVDLIIKHKISALDISLDAGCAEAYAKIRGGNWQKVWEGIDRLIAARPSNGYPVLRANMTLMKSNVWEVAKLIPLLAARKFHDLHFFHMNAMPETQAKAWRFPFNDQSGEFCYYDQQGLLPVDRLEHDTALVEAAKIADQLNFPVHCTGLFFGSTGCGMSLVNLVQSCT